MDLSRSSNYSLARCWVCFYAYCVVMLVIDEQTYVEMAKIRRFWADKQRCEKVYGSTRFITRRRWARLSLREWFFSHFHAMYAFIHIQGSSSVIRILPKAVYKSTHSLVHSLVSLCVDIAPPKHINHHHWCHQHERLCAIFALQLHHRRCWASASETVNVCVRYILILLKNNALQSKRLHRSQHTPLLLLLLTMTMMMMMILMLMMMVVATILRDVEWQWQVTTNASIYTKGVVESTDFHPI